MATVLKGLVQHFMSLSLYENAIFYAERLYYENTSHEHLHLLALCYYRMGKINQTYLLLHEASHRLSSPDNKYLYALACIALDKLTDAESTLQVVDVHGMPKMTLEAMQRVPGKASGVYLLGKISRRQHKREAAIDYFKLSLQMDPYQWSSLVELAELGVAVDIKSLYPVTHNSDSKVDIPDVKVESQGKSKSRSLFDNDNEENNPPCNDGPPVCDSIMNISSSLSQANLSYSKRLYSLNMGESLCVSESCTPPPHNSVALGLSSTSFRMPFGTPASISSPLVDQHQYQQSIYAHQQQKLLDAQKAQLFNNYSDIVNNSHSKSLIHSFSNIQSNMMLSNMDISGGGGMEGKTLFNSDFGSVSGIQSGYINRTSNSSAMGSLSDHVDPRATLFGVPTPGLTPIYNNSHMSRSYLHSGIASSEGGDHQRTLQDEFDESDAHDHLHNQFDEELVGIASKGGGRGGVVNRKVSFGPTARLSFSGVHMENQTESSEIITTSPERQRKVLEGESPYKLQRNMSNNDYSDVDIAIQRHSQPASASGMPEFSSQTNTITSSPFPVMSSPIFGNNFSTVEPSHLMNTVTPAAKKKSHIPRRMHNSTSPIPAIPDDEPEKESDSNMLHVDSSLLLSPSRSTRKAYNAPIVSPKSAARSTSPLQKSPRFTTSTKDASRAAIASPERRTINTRASEKNSKQAAAAAPTETVQPTAVAAPNAISPQVRSQAHSLLSVFGRAYQLLCLYQCDECIKLLNTLPVRHFKSGFSQQMVGKAYYESNQYKLCILAFREMLKVEPFRVQGLEIMSTAFWHLKKDKDLSALAQQVSEIDKLAPETWCVVGNCFSLQKEPETAIKFFQRSIQLDSDFAYAHTLSGHEQVNNEDLDKAIQSFRLALFANDRHYNAWYGLGSIYYRQERYDLSEYHFRRALEINGTSSVLHCYLAMALHAQGDAYKSSEGLSILEQACEVDPKNPQLHFQRAHILVDNNNLEDALEALLIVKEHAPKEPPIHALLGQVYHRLGYVQDAIRHLNTAIDLDPKEATALKQIMEHIDEPLDM